MEIITLALILMVTGFIFSAFFDIENAPKDETKDVSCSTENKTDNENDNKVKNARTTVAVKWLGRAFRLSAVILGLYAGCEYGSLSCDNVVKYTYDNSSITTVSKYFAKGDSIYAELENGGIYELETSSLTIEYEDYIGSKVENKKALIRLNNKHFSNCFVPKKTVIKYYKTNWFYISKGTKNSVLYVDKDTYAKLMDITPMDIP